MKKLLIASLLLSATLAQANHNISEPALSTIVTLYSPLTTSSPLYKEVLDLAQEDAKAFVTSEGKAEVSENLRAAIQEINAKLKAANITELGDLDAANMVLLANAINSQK